jgi:hypothetical protein
MAGTHHGFIMERAYGHPIRLWPQTHNVKMTVLAVTKQIRCSWEAFGMYDTHALGEDEGLKDELDIDAETYYKLVNDASKELYPGCKFFFFSRIRRRAAYYCIKEEKIQLQNHLPTLDQSDERTS